ncbi:AraC family transcriptional regulator [Myxococcus stipitatus DSM 14675]|uniref:AraC family transcriptional regulator n=1 Tax=Myxococcus stipitatus (strain DSM 14675 / JCM 12634 / Mx s8) TaxID=1278073 RepID=L7U0M3_MYXSD|nr:AraC family transcriptional regulator [Myxococcus stipitatus]AGC41768.1 AraC family transcriptional regulator [Myxococcus stipitatus DSM 14675]
MSAAETTGEYTELPVPNALADRVDAFWCFVAAPRREGSTPLLQRILPDGCTDLIVRFPDAREIGRGLEPHLTVVGPMERFVLTDPEPGSVCLGIRLKPGWAQALLGVSPKALCNLSIGVEDCAPAFLRLQKRLATARSLPHALALLRDEFSLRNASPLHLPNARTTHALHCLQSSAGRLSMSRLARTVGVSERTLHRDILEEAGVAPKLLARVLRFQRALTHLRAGTLDLSAVALECGYADQSHFTREVRELAGVSPTGLLS